jgi:hypothetical protein
MPGKEGSNSHLNRERKKFVYKKEVNKNSSILVKNTGEIKKVS